MEEKQALLCGRCRDVLAQKYKVRQQEEQSRTGVCTMCRDLKRVRRYTVSEWEERTEDDNRTL